MATRNPVPTKRFAAKFADIALRGIRFRMRSAIYDLSVLLSTFLSSVLEILVFAAGGAFALARGDFAGGYDETRRGLAFGGNGWLMGHS